MVLKDVLTTKHIEKIQHSVHKEHCDKRSIYVLLWSPCGLRAGRCVLCVLEKCFNTQHSGNTAESAFGGIIV